MCVSHIYIRRNINLSQMFGKINFKTLTFCFATIRLVIFNNNNDNLLTDIWTAAV
jgi:hypothetical protein